MLSRSVQNDDDDTSISDTNNGNNNNASSIYVSTDSVPTGAGFATLATYSHSNKIPHEWTNAVTGGLMIGMGSVSFLFFQGRISTVSGIMSRALDHSLFIYAKKPRTTASQWAFIFGLFGSGLYWNQRTLNRESDLFGVLSESVAFTTDTDFHPYLMFGSGILLGIGARLCKGWFVSGHSTVFTLKHSLIVMSTFMSFAFTSATLSTVYMPACYEFDCSSRTYYDWSAFVMRICAALAAMVALRRAVKNQTKKVLIPSAFSGALFGSGLCYSGVCQPNKVRAFLNLYPYNHQSSADDDDNDNDNDSEYEYEYVDEIESESESESAPPTQTPTYVAEYELFFDGGLKANWDPSLLFITAAGLLCAGICGPLILKRMRKPLLNDTFHLPYYTYTSMQTSMRSIDKKFLLGSALFGAGCGLSGVVGPAPAIVILTSRENSSAVWPCAAGIIAGMLLYHPISGLLI